MAITTGGGVAFDEGASVRNAGAAMGDTLARMQQETQFRRQQALQTADLKFGQIMKAGAADPGGLEKFLAEHPLELAEVEQLMAAATGRKISLAEGVKNGLGSISAGFAQNPSLGRMTYEYLQRLPGQAATPAVPEGGGGGEKTPVSNVPSPPGTVVEPTPAVATPTPAAPQLPASFQGDGFPIVREPIATDRTEAYKMAASGVPPVLAPSAAPAATTPAQDASELARQQARRAVQPANSFAPKEVFSYTGMPGETTPINAWATKAVPRKSGESSQKYEMRIRDWVKNFTETNNVSPVDPLDPERSYILPEGSVSPAGTKAEEGRQLGTGRTSMAPGVGAPVASYAQSVSSDVQTQAEQAAQVIKAGRASQASVPAGSPQQLQQAPGFAAWANRPATVQEPGTAPAGLTPKAQEALSRIEQKVKAPDTSETPFYDAKQAEISTAKFKDAFTKATDLAKSLMSGDASKSLKQSDKAALAAAQTRAMLISDKIKKMDPEEYQKVRSEYVKWIESATPMELQAAGLPEVATKAESVWLARFQANAAIEAARARGGSETAAAIIDMRGKAMDQVRGILDIATTTAKGDPNFKGDIAKFFQSNPMYADMLVPFASMAFGQPVKIDMILKDPTWFQKLLKQPGDVQGMGVSVNNWEGGRTAQATPAASAVEKYYSKP